MDNCTGDALFRTLLLFFLINTPEQGLIEESLAPSSNLDEEPLAHLDKIQARIAGINQHLTARLCDAK